MENLLVRMAPALVTAMALLASPPSVADVLTEQSVANLGGSTFVDLALPIAAGADFNVSYTLVGPSVLEKLDHNETHVYTGTRVLSFDFILNADPLDLQFKIPGSGTLLQLGVKESKDFPVGVSRDQLNSFVEPPNSTTPTTIIRANVIYEHIFAPIPEPTTAALFGLGLAALIGLRLRRCSPEGLSENRRADEAAMAAMVA